MFVNGQAMTGGSLHGPLERGGTLVAKAVTAPDYRFWSCRDEFPGLQPVSSGGWSVPGELYEVDYAVLRRELLPLEPPELELGVIVLADGTGSLSMRYRDEVVARADALLRPIPSGMGWLEYLDSLAGAR
jgi:gamma-glutamylcyclotransferase (GGCT)/AIG2-like uncharacterized protein YtfP